MSTRKIIQINPSLFTTKTQRRKDKQLSIKPIISPNNLKAKLLNRIKEHKNNELLQTNTNKTLGKSITEFSDEFNDSMEYLQSLSKQKQKNKLNNLTVKKYSNSYPTQHVNLELPDTLQEIVFKPHLESTSSSTSLYKVDNVVPYGVLKNGIKPTFRELHNKTLKQPYQYQQPDTITTTTPINLDREKKLQQLKNKLKEEELLKNIHKFEKEEEKDEDKPVITDPYIKKTISKKYILGKNNKTRTISILLKDRETRKRIIDAAKQLRCKPIVEMKKYLRDHNLIKVGSSAPTEVIKQMYESSIMAGDIVNHNKNNLLHNLSSNNN